MFYVRKRPKKISFASILPYTHNCEHLLKLCRTLTPNATVNHYKNIIKSKTLALDLPVFYYAPSKSARRLEITAQFFFLFFFFHVEITGIKEKVGIGKTLYTSLSLLYGFHSFTHIVSWLFSCARKRV